MSIVCRVASKIHGVFHNQDGLRQQKIVPLKSRLLYAFLNGQAYLWIHVWIVVRICGWRFPDVRKYAMRIRKHCVIAVKVIRFPFRKLISHLASERADLFAPVILIIFRPLNRDAKWFKKIPFLSPCLRAWKLASFNWGASGGKTITYAKDELFKGHIFSRPQPTFIFGKWIFFKFKWLAVGNTKTRQAENQTIWKGD